MKRANSKAFALDMSLTFQEPGPDYMTLFAANIKEPQYS